MGRTALVAGATGLIGTHLTALLLADPAYEKVTVLVRRAMTVDHPKLTQRVVDYDHLEREAKSLQVDDLFCCLGTTIKKAGSQAAFRRVDYDYPLALAEMGAQAGVKQYLIVTAMGADPRSSFFYNRVKGEVEQALKALHLPALHLFRPSLLLGQRAEHRLGERLGAVFARALTPALIGPLRPYRPIAGAVVADAMLRCAKRSIAGLHTYDYAAIAALASAP